MADVDSLHQEYYVLGDVGGVIADPLQIARHENQVDVYKRQ